MIQEKYSYSSIACFKQCPYKYKLIYIDHNFIPCPSIATDFGTLIHHIEEQIGKDLQEGLYAIDILGAIKGLKNLELSDKTKEELEREIDVLNAYKELG